MSRSRRKHEGYADRKLTTAKSTVAGIPTDKGAEPRNTTSKPSPDCLAYSRKESFGWLKGAAILETTTSEEQKYNDPLIKDYCNVRKSEDLARTILIGLIRQEFSIDDLAKKRNEQGTVTMGSLRVDEKKQALRIVKTTGSVKNRTVSYAIDQAKQQGDVKFFVELGHALNLKQRPPEYDPQRISIVARFLVENWCRDNWFVGHVNVDYSAWLGILSPDRKRDLGGWGKPNSFFFMPPLCFFDEERLAGFSEIVLGKGTDITTKSITKWVSRLKLVRASHPKITAIRREAEGRLHFGMT
jgi:hypothetical protein